MKFDRSIKNVEAYLDSIGLKHIYSGVKWKIITGKRESRYVRKTDKIYLHPKDVIWSWTFGTTQFSLIVHELAHRFFEKILTKKEVESERITKIFGRYHKKYIRNFKSASMSRDLSSFASRYSLVHPADDCAEIFSVCLQYMIKGKDPLDFIKEHNKNKKCENKIKLMKELLNDSCMHQ